MRWTKERPELSGWRWHRNAALRERAKPVWFLRGKIDFLERDQIRRPPSDYDEWSDQMLPLPDEPEEKSPNFVVCDNCGCPRSTPLHCPGCDTEWWDPRCAGCSNEDRCYTEDELRAVARGAEAVAQADRMPRSALLELRDRVDKIEKNFRSHKHRQPRGGITTGPATWEWGDSEA